ncbi:MAG: phosphoribosylformylglycinamidine synthase subunit PurL [Planctomycetota bacterium]
MPEVHRVEVAVKSAALDSAGKGVADDLRRHGLEGVKIVRTVRVYTLAGLSLAQARLLARELLADGVAEDFSVDAPVLSEEGLVAVEIARRPGVMDPAEASVRKGAAYLGAPCEWVRTSTRYLVEGRVSAEAVRLAAGKLLANDLIEEIALGKTPPAPSPGGVSYEFRRVEVPLEGLDDGELLRLSTEKQLYLSPAEMRAIQAYFRGQGRPPTDAELETLAQTWSEHCVHKTLKGRIRYTGPDGAALIDSLFKTYIARATRELGKDWCLSVFQDNAGVIAFDETHGAVFKVETHNHPSALEPYGGAGTGIGGVIRDCLGTGLGARPVMNTDVFCFGPPDLPQEKLPRGALHPRRVLRGVVAGVRDYGNRMGIPTANGAIVFDERYLGNPLVFCGTVGIIPRACVAKEARAGQIALLVGGATGRDGIHGATFSSVELHEESERISSGAVQIGNPIEEKKVCDFLLRARDLGLFSSVTDCGAGGLSSALGEMGAAIGVEVELDAVPLKYAGLSYTEIWISEAQERMVLAADADRLEALRRLAREEDVALTVVGRFTGDRMLRLRYRGAEVGLIEMEFLHEGMPRVTREAVWAEPRTAEPVLPLPGDYGGDLKRILGSWNVCSKEWVIRQYDHEVQGGSVLKPLVGAQNDGPGDAAVIAPLLGSRRGLAVACGLNPRYSDLDPYWMAASAIDEALRNIVSVGASLERCALLDNFCWGNTDKPDRLGGLVRAARACYDFATAYGVPFISGKDSLNNEFASAEGTIAIPGTLLISALAVMEDVTRAVSMDAKEKGNAVYVIGRTRDELGASHYFALHDALGVRVPKVHPAEGLGAFRALSECTAQGLVRALHDLSEGGLAVAAAETAFAGGLGMELSLAGVPVPEHRTLRTDALLFSESQSRFLAEVAPPSAAAFERILRQHEVAFGRIGSVTGLNRLVVADASGSRVIDEPLDGLRAAWQAPLAW